MGLSRTQIYNNALLKVSKKTVDTPDDDTFEANTCNSLWEAALDRSVTSHNWSRATRLVTVNETASDPIALYGKSFQLPNDCEKVVRAYKSTDRDDS